jgi:hypothetical protein
MMPIDQPAADGISAEEIREITRDLADRAPCCDNASNYRRRIAMRQAERHSDIGPSCSWDFERRFRGFDL